MTLSKRTLIAIPLFTLIITGILGLFVFLHIGDTWQWKLTDQLYPRESWREVSNSKNDEQRNDQPPTSQVMTDERLTDERSLNKRLENERRSEQQLTDNRITIVAIDEKSLSDEIGLGRWSNWRRSFYAKAIEHLNTAGAKVIGIDLFFNKKQTGIPGADIETLVKNAKNDPKDIVDALQKYADSNGHPDDLELSETLKKNNNVVLATYGGIPEHAANELPKILAMEPLVPILQANSTTGYVNVFPDEDSVVRRTIILAQRENVGKRWFEESFDLQILRKFYGLPAEKIDEREKDGYTVIQKIDNNYQFADTFIPFEGVGKMLIAFEKPRLHFDTISFSDAYSNRFDPRKVKDRIVLIGITAMELRDVVTTPNSKVTPMPGVEVHAHALKTILDQNFLQTQSEKMQIIIIAVIALLSVTLFLTIGIIQSFILLIFTVLFIGVASIGSFRSGIIIPSLSYSMTAVLSFIVTLGYRYFTELKQKRFIKNAFEHYISKEFVEEIANDPKKLILGGEKRELTVFFSDIAGFTSFSEKISPEKMVSQMYEYFSVMTSILMRNGGTLDKYEGDAIMAFFGAPIHYKNHAERACRSALECRNALNLLNEKWEQEARPKLDFRIGLNTGEVIVGNIGSKARFNYTVMGDTVNLASRLEKANKETNTHILMSETTHIQIAEKFTTLKLGPLTIRGKKEPIWVYELIAM
ncbi:adenylate/guanylate cyclase domain-containing protein [Candidatus Peregrinibacteria bacterium]|nr:adenylate/guanylate cyclase domain-containing protein [Candidatus Peregrinibacteria bacterium]